MPAATRMIEMLAFPAMQMLDVTGPLQVFASANDFVAEDGGEPPYVFRVVAPSGERVTASAGLGLMVEQLPLPEAAVDTFDGCRRRRRPRCGRGPEAGRMGANPRRTRAPRRLGLHGSLPAGVLDGRRATTHWSFCADLARRFPAVRVEADPIFVRDGPVWTSAGVTAGIDLALALVEQDLGRTLALEVARYLVVFLKRPGGQAQFSTALSLQAADDRFAALHDWIGAHLDEDISLTVLAREAGMSERRFSRHYAEATGLTPARAVERLRVEAARRLLLDSHLPVKRISQRCGFGSEETMRRSFLRVPAVTPQDYRARFSSSRPPRGGREAEWEVSETSPPPNDCL